MTFNLNLQYVDPSGKPITGATATSLTKAAEKDWTGTFGSYQTTANFHNPDATKVTVVVNPGGGVSNTSAVGGNTVQMFMAGYQKPGGALIPYNKATRNQTFAHEIGHVLGARDQYTGSGTALSGHGRDLMGSVSPGTRPLGSTVREILVFNGVSP